MDLTFLSSIVHKGGRRIREVSPTPVGATLWEHIEEENVALATQAWHEFRSVTRSVDL